MQAGSRPCRRRRKDWAGHLLTKHLPQVQQHGGTVALAAVAVLGWALYLLERLKGRHHEHRRSSPSEDASNMPRLHCPGSELDIESRDEVLTARAAANLGAAPAAETTAAEQQAGPRELLAAQLDELRQAATACLPEGGTGKQHVSAGLLLVREEVQLLDLAEELEALRAQLDQKVLEHARSALSADCSAAPSLACSRAGTEQASAAGDQAGDQAWGSPGQLPRNQQVDSEVSSKLSTFQQRLRPLTVHPSSSQAAALPASPILHSSLQPSPGQPTAPQEHWLSGAEPPAAGPQPSEEGGISAAVLAEGMLDDMLLASPVPVAPAALTQPDFGAGLEQQSGRWSPKATVVSLASLRSSAPALVTAHQGTTLGGASSTLCTRKGPPGRVSTPAANLGRMLRQSASLDSRQLNRSLASFQELTAAHKLATARKVEAAAGGGCADLIPACYSTSTAPASTAPSFACSQPGDNTPGVGSRIPRGPRSSGVSPAADATPGSRSRIPRPSS